LQKGYATVFYLHVLVCVLFFFSWFLLGVFVQRKATATDMSPFKSSTEAVLGLISICFSVPMALSDAYYQAAQAGLLVADDWSSPQLRLRITLFASACYHR
jgi:hypothetical protein